MQIKTRSPKETYALGRRLAEHIRPGGVICLEGDLGAGKTLFAQGIVKGLNAPDEVTSPTFSIMNVYHGDLDVYHFDLYRLERVEELQDIGFYEYAKQDDGVSLIEWPDRFPEELPVFGLWIKMERGASEEERVISFDCRTDELRGAMEELKQNCRF